LKNEPPTLIFASRAIGLEEASKARRTKVNGRSEGLSILPVLSQENSSVSSPYTSRQHHDGLALVCTRAQGIEYDQVRRAVADFGLSSPCGRQYNTNGMAFGTCPSNRQKMEERNDALLGDSLVQEGGVQAKGSSRQQGHGGRGWTQLTGGKDVGCSEPFKQDVDPAASSLPTKQQPARLNGRPQEHEAHGYSRDPMWRQAASRISRSNSVQEKAAKYASEGRRWPISTGIDRDLLRRARGQDEIDGPVAAASGRGGQDGGDSRRLVAAVCGQDSSRLGASQQRVWSGCASRARLLSGGPRAGWVGQGAAMLEREVRKGTTAQGSCSISGAQGSSSGLVRDSPGVWDGGPLRLRCLDLLRRPSWRPGPEPRGLSGAWDVERIGEGEGSDGFCTDAHEDAGDEANGADSTLAGATCGCKTCGCLP
jgi:hypothetical protein